MLIVGGCVQRGIAEFVAEGVPYGATAGGQIRQFIHNSERYLAHRGFIYNEACVVNLVCGTLRMFYKGDVLPNDRALRLYNHRSTARSEKRLPCPAGDLVPGS